MRKWMRDKLKRRKKSQEEAATGPAPLQPAYFEPEMPPQKAEPRSAEPLEEVEPSEEYDQGQSAANEPSAPVETPDAPKENTGAVSASDPMRRPRRRRRGGRGRRRPGQQQPAAQQAAGGSSASVSPAVAEPPVGAESASTPVLSVPAPAQRASKGVVVLAVGLPGSGKSSWFKRHNITPLSSDVLRTMLFDDPTEQRFQDLVFSNLRSMLKARLIARRPMNYVDATNLTPHERHNWIKLAKDFGYEVHAVFFNVPLEVCIERHQRRDRIVPEDVMRKMSAKLKAPSFEEGFSKITVVRVKQKEAEA
jgi:predicted kinase